MRSIIDILVIKPAEKKVNNLLELSERTYRYLIHLTALTLVFFSYPTLLNAQQIDLESKWASNQRCFLESSATVADIDNNAWDEVLIASQEEMMAAGKNGNGKVVWQADGAGYQTMKLGQSREIFDLVCSVSKMNDFRNEIIECIKSILETNYTRQQNKTWAEKLGFPAEKKVLILHCDDAGMCPEANSAAERYLENGFVQSAAVMMPCPAAGSFIEWANSHPQADVGIHLTMNSEWKIYRWGPVSDPAKVPGLIDPDGMLWHEVVETVTHASPAEVNSEIRAQIEKSIALGHRPTHIDTHMGTLYGSIDYLKVFLRAAEDYNIPANAIDLSDPEVAAKFKQEGYPITDEVISFMGDYKLPKLDNFTSVPEGSSYEEKRSGFFDLVRSLEPGLTEIIFHPSVQTDNLKTITNSWQQRVWEGELFSDPVVKEFFDDEGIIITNWKEIMKRFGEKSF